MTVQYDLKNSTRLSFSNLKKKNIIFELKFISITHFRGNKFH